MLFETAENHCFIVQTLKSNQLFYFFRINYSLYFPLCVNKQYSTTHYYGTIISNTYTQHNVLSIDVLTKEQIQQH